MYRNRLIPCLSLRGHGLVKTIQFKDGRYLGDPINAVKIFNDREVDEIFILDIDASKKGNHPDIDYLKKITQQCFMPAGYAGGISSYDDVCNLFEIGFEKVAIGTAAYRVPGLVEKAVGVYGAQSIVGVMDVRNDKGHSSIFIESGREKVSDDAVDYAKQLASYGIGELFINSIDRDGMMNGYDLDLIRTVSKAVEIPVVACGGAGSIQDCKDAINVGASAVAASSIFVYWGRKKAVLISYPNSEERDM